MSNFAGSSGDVESGSVSDSEKTESVVQGPNQGRLLIQKATVYMYSYFAKVSWYNRCYHVLLTDITHEQL